METPAAASAGRPDEATGVARYLLPTVYLVAIRLASKCFSCKPNVLLPLQDQIIRDLAVQALLTTNGHC